MAAEAEATREAKAKVIAAEGEKKASEALRGIEDLKSIMYLWMPILLNVRFCTILKLI